MDLFWDTLFWTTMPTWMTFNDFLPILGSARGAHRGSNEPCFPVLKTLLGPNGPNTYLRAPQGSPRPPKITPRLPKASKKHPVTSIFFDLVWCSDVPILSQLSCVISVAVMCCLNFVPTHVCSQLSQFCPTCSAWFVLLYLLCELCPKTCLQPTAPIMSQLWCVIFVAVLCCVTFVPKHVCNQQSKCWPNCYVWCP